MYNETSLKFYYKAQKVIAPTLKYSQSFYEDTVKTYVKPNIKWLDLGCGHHILEIWRSEVEKKLVEMCDLVAGIDYDLNSLRKHKILRNKMRGDITDLPLKDDTFDLITANMVAEHLKSPEVQFREIRRILKPEGIVIFHTPNSIGYTSLLAKAVPFETLRDKIIYFIEGRESDDIFDTYFRLNTKGEIENLAHRSGYEVVSIRSLVSTPKLINLPFLCLFELLFIRMLMNKPFKAFRTNLIAVLRKR